MNLINVNLNSKLKARSLFFIFSVLLVSGCANKQAGEQVDLTLSQALESSQLELQFQQGVELVEQSRFDEAKIILETIHQAHPDVLGPILNLGFISTKQQDFEIGKSYYSKALQLKPKHIGSMISLAYIAREAGHFDEAENYYRLVFEIEPNNLMALKNLGILLDLYRGRFAEALALYERYQSLLTAPDPKIKDWIFDTKNRLKAE